MFDKIDKRIKIIIAIAIILGLGFIIFGNINKITTSKNIVLYSEFIMMINEKKVDTIYLSNEEQIKVKLIDGSYIFTDNPRSISFKEELLKSSIKVSEVKYNSVGKSSEGIGISLIMLGIMSFFIISLSLKQKSSSFNKSKAISKQTNKDLNIGFDKVAGNDEAKESLMDIIDFLKNPDKYTKYGARMPRGVILYGPPGTGKTLMAKAVAGEANTSFFALSGSDFVQVYVGVGAARIRELFKKAKDKGKSVIFIDEIDALGKKRESSVEGGNDEREQTLNALLSEMSGFEDNEGIIVIAATNRLDVLDEALLRPGRFDRHIEISLPDLNSRAEILKVHLKNKPISSLLDIGKIAEQTVYFSGAMLESMVNEAAIFAAKENSRFIEKYHLDKAFYTVIAGYEKKDRSSIMLEDKSITAYHEAGHALISKLVAKDYKVNKISIIPGTKGMGGYTMSIPKEKMYKSKKDLENDIMIALGGRAAEEIIFGSDKITTGAASDIEKATEIILSMIKRWGMNESTGILNYDILFKNSLKGINDDMILECKNIIDKKYDYVKKLIIDNKDKLELLTNELLAKETLDFDEIEYILK